MIKPHLIEVLQRQMSNKSKPNWHPINALPMIASIIDEMLKDTENQYQTLLEVRISLQVVAFRIF